MNMDDKKQRNKVKKSLKKQVKRIIPGVCGINAHFDFNSQKWVLWVCVDFEIPSELSDYREGLDKDIQREDVIAFMKEKEKEIVSLMKKHFQAEYKPEEGHDFNFTVPFPPLSSVKRENGVLRLKTKEEKEEDKKLPFMKEIIESDDEILEKGYFKFIGEEGIPEYGGFALVKYASLRARYTFLLPQPQEVVL